MLGVCNLLNNNTLFIRGSGFWPTNRMSLTRLTLGRLPVLCVGFPMKH